jgi:N6-adenosine-specific RNA methylase IME4
MYKIIYADPPWSYAKRSVNKQTKFGAGVHGQYATMTEQEIADMGQWIHSIADRDCALFLWTTGPRMDMAFRVVEAWNSTVRYKRDRFRYATKAFTWVKVAKKVKLKQDVKLTKGTVVPAGKVVPYKMLDERTIVAASAIKGTGNYTGSNTEDVLLFIKGSMLSMLKEKLVPQVIFHPRMEHSTKPAEVRDRIVRMFGDVPRTELFARKQIAGWTASGLELDGTDYRQLSAVGNGALQAA